MSIVVTGMGIVSAIGNTTAEVLDSLLRKESGIGQMRYLTSAHRELPVGEVKMSDEEMKVRLGLTADTLVSRTSLMAALAVNQAVEEAEVKVNAVRMVLVNGTTVGGMDITERHFRTMRDHGTHLEAFSHHDCGSCTQEIAAISRLHAGQPRTVTISTACSSSLNAIIRGAQLLEAAEADVAICGGSEALTLFHLNGFNSLMILDHEPCRPFCDTRAGLNLGEGAAFLVMEREQEAVSRGAHIVAYVSGYGNACDAYHYTATSPRGEGAYLAMREALQMASLAPTAIDYIHAHGTGTPDNDASETAAIQRLFGPSLPAISSTKSSTGHTTSAAGAIGAVVTLLAMRHGFIPANVGWKRQMAGGFIPSAGTAHAAIRHALCNSFGFGGNDSSLLFSADAPEPERSHNSYHSRKTYKSFECAVSELPSDALLRQYVPPMEARRMGKLLKVSLYTAMQALQEAGIEKPDAIVTATERGMLQTTEKFLNDLIDGGEQLLKPSLFMQSTHNTLGSQIAIRLQCHGYNITYSNGRQSWDDALADARRLITTGRARSVLVGLHDESTPLFSSFMSSIGVELPPMLYSRSLVLVAD